MPLKRVIFAHDIRFSRGGSHSLVAVESPFYLAQFRKVGLTFVEIVFHITTYFQTTDFPLFEGMDFLRFAPKQVGEFLPTGGGRGSQKSEAAPSASLEYPIETNRGKKVFFQFPDSAQSPKCFGT